MDKRERVARAIFASNVGERVTWDGVHEAVRLQAFRMADAAIAALEPVTVWQPIETAPKDGSDVDLWTPDGGRLPECFWDNGWRAYGDMLVGPEWGDPTHWMPIPAPPALADTGEDG